jgi:hypothetical protein
MDPLMTDKDRRWLLGGLGATAALAAPGLAGAQDLGRILGQVAQSGLPRGVSERDAQSGLREALSNGAVSAILRLGRADGYWGNPVVRIPLPDPLDDVQSLLRPLRQSRMLDDLHLFSNRGAESAAPQARTIFLDAIRSFSITDIVGVLRGPETAGTQLLSERTRPGLLGLFRPPMVGALDQSGASPTFERVANRYNRQIGRLGGFGSGMTTSGGSLRDQFVDFCVGKALDGLFHYVGEEEKLIRRDPVKRTSDLLRRVFGGL